jgi:hypothetical protein
MLIAAITAGGEPEVVHLESQLIVRGTTAPPRDALPHS